MILSTILKRSRRSTSSYLLQNHFSVLSQSHNGKSNLLHGVKNGFVFSSFTQSASGVRQKLFEPSLGPYFYLTKNLLRRRLSSVAVDTIEHASNASETSKYSSLFSFLIKNGKCYFQLSKARLSFLVMTTATAGFVLGSEEIIDFKKLFWASLGTMMTALSANSFNQVMEMKNDSLMKRTMNRPLPSGRMSKAHALTFAITMGASGVMILLNQTNELTAGLGASNLGLYVLAYTPLKQIHFVNTWVGAVVGAIPPVMGWTAATGRLDIQASILGLAVYFWQMPHFMALAWLCRKDYAIGGFQMLSLLDQTGKRTAAVSLRNCLYLLPLGFLAVHLDLTSDVFAYENLALTATMAIPAISFYRNPTNETARMLFRTSLLYLSALMVAIIIHRKPYSLQNTNDEFSWLYSPLSDQKESKKQHKESTSASLDTYLMDVKSKNLDYEVRSKAIKPPVAYLSAAPFPFLPLPEY